MQFYVTGYTSSIRKVEYSISPLIRTVKKGCRKGEMQEKGCRKGGRQEQRDLRKEGDTEAGIQERRR